MRCAMRGNIRKRQGRVAQGNGHHREGVRLGRKQEGSGSPRSSNGPESAHCPGRRIDGPKTYCFTHNELSVAGKGTAFDGESIP